MFTVSKHFFQEINISLKLYDTQFLDTLKQFNMYEAVVSPLLKPLIKGQTLREKCPNTELFLVRIQENTDQKSFCIWTLFTQ